MVGQSLTNIDGDGTGDFNQLGICGWKNRVRMSRSCPEHFVILESSVNKNCQFDRISKLVDAFRCSSNPSDRADTTDSKPRPQADEIGICPEKSVDV
ncbi:hypothetical protein GALL_461900 [mine drainage metagenome]|uniref:Uncharacterized protein n=1 Tax=mine drainage metagenome TaxID=410659 RepID=A0A1J5PX98_9ZZZZ